MVMGMTTTGVMMTGTMIAGIMTTIIMIADSTVGKKEGNMKGITVEGPMCVFQ
jgi:hypothetical protein